MPKYKRSVNLNNIIQLIYWPGVSSCASTSETDGDLSVGMPSPISFNDIQNASLNRIESAQHERTKNDQTSQCNDSCESSSVYANNRNPTCSICRNHGVICKLKGHKRYCPWRACTCPLCHTTNKKRKINATQVAMRRAHAQDKELENSQNNEPVNNDAGDTRTSSSSQTLTPLNDAAGRQHWPKTTATADTLHGKSQMANAAYANHSPKDAALYGQQLLGSLNVLDQGTSLLRDSLLHDALHPNQKSALQVFQFLDHVIKETLLITHEVSHKLKRVQSDIQQYLGHELVSHRVNSSSSYSSTSSFMHELPRTLPIVPISQYAAANNSQYPASVVNRLIVDHQTPIMYSYQIP